MEKPQNVCMHACMDGRYCHCLSQLTAVMLTHAAEQLGSCAANQAPAQLPTAQQFAVHAVMCCMILQQAHSALSAARLQVDLLQYRCFYCCQVHASCIS